MGKSKRDKKSSKKKQKHKAHHKSKRKSKKVKNDVKHRSSKDKHLETDNKHNKRKEEVPELDSFAIPVELMNSKSHAPETPQEYERRQSQIRRLTDPVTGRVRLIKGDGEVLEEIVSREHHTEINKQATQGDGRFFVTYALDVAAKKNRKQ